MSVDVFTPVMIETKIHDIAQRISASVKVCDERYRAKLQTDRDYDAAYAQAYLAHEGPQAEKRYAAEDATTAKREARDVAEAAWKYADRLARALSDELDAYRSLGVSVRQAYSTAGMS